jgi:multidrug efflux pump subunit AcrB
LALSGLAEQDLNDIGLNFLRTQLITVPGASIPYPYGGKQRQIMVDLNPALLQSKGLSATDVTNTLALQDLVLPSGTVKIDQFEYDVDMNASPTEVDKLNDLPIKVVGNSTLYLRDVAHVRDGFPADNIVRQEAGAPCWYRAEKAATPQHWTSFPGLRHCCQGFSRHYRRS